MKYRRSRNGTTIHRSDCKLVTVTNSLPWHYADNFPPDAIVTVCANSPWLKPCRKCNPDKATP